MNEQELIEFLSNRLSIEIEDKRNFGNDERIIVRLLLDNVVISSDFIYTE